jgi:hypothetical protein
MPIKTPIESPTTPKQSSTWPGLGPDETASNHRSMLSLLRLAQMITAFLYSVTMRPFAQVNIRPEDGLPTRTFLWLAKSTDIMALDLNRHETTYTGIRDAQRRPTTTSAKNSLVTVPMAPYCNTSHLPLFPSRYLFILTKHRHQAHLSNKYPTNTPQIPW